jgi:hypothetical protein
VIARFAVPLKTAIACVCTLALVACTSSAPVRSVQVESVVAPAQADMVIAPVVTQESAVALMHYARVQQQLLSQGLLRTDGGGRDTPYTDRMLAENFLRIALYDEYSRSVTGPVQKLTASRLRRWEMPVRVGLRFGPSVPPERRATDTARVASYLARLERTTGHIIRLDDTAPNFWVFIVNETERQTLDPQIRSALPGLTAVETAGITQMPRSTYCLVYAMSEGAGSVYTRAFAVIRAEHPDLLRLSCIHEEIAQGLGLANDSPTARPSIFNDDEEFALLTTQDEMMLRMLYNPALRPGMTEYEARPIVESLAARLLGGDS